MKNKFFLLFLFFFTGSLFGQMEEKGEWLQENDGISSTANAIDRSFIHGEEIPLQKKNFTYPILGSARYYFYPITKARKKAILQIYLRDDLYQMGEEAYLELSPYGKGVMMDVFILGDWRLYHKIFLPYSLTEAIEIDLDSLLKASEKMVDWKWVLPSCNRHYYKRIEDMIQTIRNRLFLISKDSTMANSFSFSKWVIDGIYLAKKDHTIPLLFLNQKAYSERGGRHVLVLEDSRNPFHALDWSRNLALAMDLLENSEAKYGDRDINYLSKIKSYEDSGFPIQDLERVLYLLAIKNPQSFYLGSLSQNKISAHDVRIHEKIYILFPRINLQGQLETVIFESGKEMDLKGFLEGLTDEHIHLVEIQTHSDYTPGKYEILSVIKR